MIVADFRIKIFYPENSLNTAFTKGPTNIFLHYYNTKHHLSQFHKRNVATLQKTKVEGRKTAKRPSTIVE